MCDFHGKVGIASELRFFIIPSSPSWVTKHLFLVVDIVVALSLGTCRVYYSRNLLDRLTWTFETWRSLAGSSTLLVASAELSELDWRSLAGLSELSELVVSIFLTPWTLKTWLSLFCCKKFDTSSEVKIVWSMSSRCQRFRMRSGGSTTTLQ